MFNIIISITSTSKILFLFIAMKTQIPVHQHHTSIKHIIIIPKIRCCPHQRCFVSFFVALFLHFNSFHKPSDAELCLCEITNLTFTWFCWRWFLRQEYHFIAKWYTQLCISIPKRLHAYDYRLNISDGQPFHWHNYLGVFFLPYESFVLNFFLRSSNLNYS